MRHRPRQTLSGEDIAGDTCVHSSCGTVVMPLLPGFFPAPSWHTCTSLAWGGLGHGSSSPPALFVAPGSKRRQTLVPLLWLPRRSPRPATLAPLGGGHAPGSAVGPCRRGPPRQRRRYDQDQSGPPARRAGPLAPGRRRRPARIPPPAGGHGVLGLMPLPLTQRLSPARAANQEELGYALLLAA
jgi:hypothetical protein